MKNLVIHPALAVGDGWTKGRCAWRIVRGGRISEDHSLGYADFAPEENTIWMPVSPMWITDSTSRWTILVLSAGYITPHNG